jgi:hypothetical protein
MDRINEWAGLRMTIAYSLLLTQTVTVSNSPLSCIFRLFFEYQPAVPALSAPLKLPASAKALRRLRVRQRVRGMP